MRGACVLHFEVVLHHGADGVLRCGHLVSLGCHYHGIITVATTVLDDRLFELVKLLLPTQE